MTGDTIFAIVGPVSVAPDQPPPWPPIPERPAASTDESPEEPAASEFGGPMVIRGVVVAVILAAVALVAAWAFAGGRAPAEANTPSSHADSSDDGTTPASEESSSSDKPSKSSSSDSPSKTQDPLSMEPSTDSPGTHSHPGHGPVPSAPNDFEAWYTYQGYQAMWEPPSDDGGSEISSYVVGDCHGDVLATVDGGTTQAVFDSGELDCLSVHAVNANGGGRDARTDPDN